MSEDIILETKRRIFFFGGGTNPLEIHVHQGKAGRWRWSVTVKESGETVALSPVNGWETPDEANGAARGFFAVLGVALEEVSE